MSLESQLQAALLLAAPARIPELRLFRRNVATVQVQGRTIKAGIRGQADIYGYFRGGRAIELELKGPTTRMTPEQEAWQAFCRGWGIPHLVLRARKGESVEETVTRWCEEIASLVSL